MVEIRRAVYDDIPMIMQFMNEHWKPGNILATNREFFEWQFVDGDKVNMFIGVDNENGKIYGIIGAVVYSKSSNPDVSGCTWQVIRSSNPMLGINLLHYMCEQLNVRYNLGAGLSDRAVKINRLLKYVITEMDHYYRLADRKEYKIAKIEKKIIPQVKETGYYLNRIDSLEEMKQIIPENILARQILRKDYEYIEKRYFKHPIYHYDIWKIMNGKEISQSVLITRDEILQGGRVCKIIDYYGRAEVLGKLALALDYLMEEKGYEFVDVYSYGISREIYEEGGFVRCDTSSENIIPNYFHPFIQENISLKMVEPLAEGVRLFRGDGDQDRPC